MEKYSIIFVCFFLILALPSFIAIEPSFASASIPKPSVPQFIVKLVDSSYDIPATTAVDPYTGKTVTQAGRHIESRTIKLYIKCESIEPFIVETSTGNWTAGLQYNIRWKGHFQQDWHEIYTATNGYAGGEMEGDYLVVSYEGKYSSDGLDLYYQGLIARFPPEGQVDFQVEAMVGYVSRDPLAIGWVFNGETSGWSSTQTITIGESTQTATPDVSQSSISPSANPTAIQVFGLDLVGVAVLVLIFVITVLLLFVVFYLRKRR
jgi:hypothetical protein